MPVIQHIEKRYGAALYGSDNSDDKRLIPAIVIGIVGFFCLICYVFLRQRAQKRHGADTNRVFSSSQPTRRPPGGSDPVIQSWDRRATSAEIRRREAVIARAAEARRMEAIHLEQLNAELAAEAGEPKPPGYAPPVHSMLNVDGTPRTEVARPVAAAHREGEELPGYEPRRTNSRRSGDRAGADLDDPTVVAIVADPPPAYTPRPGGDSSTAAPVNRAVT